MLPKQLLSFQGNNYISKLCFQVNRKKSQSGRSIFKADGHLTNWTVHFAKKYTIIHFDPFEPKSIFKGQI